MSKAPFHDLDDALDGISGLGGGYAAAAAAAALFARTGAGSAAVTRYVAAGHDVLGTAVGVTLQPADIETALRLLAVPIRATIMPSPTFFGGDAEWLAGTYHDDVVRLVTHPSRAPAGFGADAAAAAFHVFPDDDDFVILWSQWIRKGLFDNRGDVGAAGPRAFAHWSAKGLRAGSAGWSRVFDAFSATSVRSCARSQRRRSTMLSNT